MTEYAKYGLRRFVTLSSNAADLLMRINDIEFIMGTVFGITGQCG